MKIKMHILQFLVFILEIKNKMERIESNVINSFSLVKKDILRLQNDYMDLKVAYARLLGRLEKMEFERLPSKLKIMKFKSDNSKKKVKKASKKKVAKTKKRVSKVKTVKTTYVASKEGKKFHDLGCVTLKKVSGNNLVSYASKKEAVKKGLKPCGTCIPR